MSATDSRHLETWIRDRDAHAFEALTRRYSELVFATCFRITRDRMEAEDATQECFTTLASIAQVPHAPLGPWLHRVATNGSLNRVKARARRTSYESTFAREQEHAVEIAWKDVERLVDEALVELPEKVRVPLVEHFLEGESYTAIAESLGTTRQTVTNRVDKGIAQIRRALSRRGVSVSLSSLSAMMGSHLAEATTVPTATLASLAKIALAGPTLPPAVTSGVIGALPKFVGGFMMSKSTVVGSGVIVAMLLAAVLYTSNWPYDQPEGGRNAGGSEFTGSLFGSNASRTGDAVVEVPEATDADATEIPPSIPDEEDVTPEVEVITQENFVASNVAREPEGDARISGGVTDVEGNGIANAEILLGMNANDGGDFETLTGDDGAFEIVGLAETQYLIGARSPGYAPKYVRAEATEGTGTFTVIKLSRGGGLEGRITYAGEAFSSCRVRLFHLGENTSGQKDVWPNAEGYYQLDALGAGTYQVEVMTENPDGRLAHEARAITAKVEIEEGKITEANFDFSPVASSVAGRITIGGDASIEAAVTILLVNADGDEERRRVETDSDGYYVIDGLGAGIAKIQIRAEASDKVPYFTVREVSLPEGEEIALDIEVVSGSIIAGLISDVPKEFEAGAFVLHGDVELKASTLEAFIDLYQTAAVVVDPINGDTFRATGFEAGTYTVIVMAVKQTTTDPFGDVVTERYLVELGKGDEALIEHSFK